MTTSVNIGWCGGVRVLTTVARLHHSTVNSDYTRWRAGGRSFIVYYRDRDNVAVSFTCDTESRATKLINKAVCAIECKNIPRHVVYIYGFQPLDELKLK